VSDTLIFRKVWCNMFVHHIVYLEARDLCSLQLVGTLSLLRLLWS
jgi:hypothetical protein